MTKVRALLFLLASCAGGSSGGGLPQGGACLPIVPMTLLVLEHGTEWEPIAKLEADGTIVHGKQGVVGGLGAEQMFDRDHKSVMWCAPDRTLHLPSRPGPMARFDAEDRLVDSDGSVLFISDDGMVHWMRGGRDILGNARFEPDVRGAKRTAILVVFATLANGRWGF